MNLFEEIGTKEFKNLIAGNAANINYKGITLKIGMTYAVGSVVAKETATDLHVLVDKNNADGATEAAYVLPEEVDATAADTTTAAIQSGVLNRQALIVGAGNTIEEHEAALRKNNIILKDMV